MLFHIAETSLWEAAASAGEYRAPSLAAEGFIHCSDERQVLATAERYYAMRSDLVLLEIDGEGLDIRWEVSTGGERFPHLYGALPLGSVRAVHAFMPGADGRFALPGQHC